MAAYFRHCRRTEREMGNAYIHLINASCRSWLIFHFSIWISHFVLLQHWSLVQLSFAMFLK